LPIFEDDVCNWGPATAVALHSPRWKIVIARAMATRTPEQRRPGNRADLADRERAVFDPSASACAGADERTSAISPTSPCCARRSRRASRPRATAAGRSRRDRKTPAERKPRLRASRGPRVASLEIGALSAEGGQRVRLVAVLLTATSRLWRFLPASAAARARIEHAGCGPGLGAVEGQSAWGSAFVASAPSRGDAATAIETGARMGSLRSRRRRCERQPCPIRSRSRRPSPCRLREQDRELLAADGPGRRSGASVERKTLAMP